MLEKLASRGKNALKILDVQDRYLLGEMRSYRPPYRLYVYVDQERDEYYAVRWEHKDRQEKVIRELKERLYKAIKRIK